MRRILLPLSAAVFATSLGIHAYAQVDPNPQPNQMQQFMQQLRDNMQNSGVTPQDIIQSAGQQMQQGTFNLNDFVGQLQGAGVLNQDMVGQLGQWRDQAQQRWQQQGGAMPMRGTNALQQLLNSPNEEWNVLSPKIQRVLELSSDLGENRSGIRYSNQQTGAATKARTELYTVLSNPETTDDQIVPRLAAYREACKQVRADLAAARTDLIAFLTLRQESILLSLQVID